MCRSHSRRFQCPTQTSPRLRQAVRERKSSRLHQGKCKAAVLPPSGTVKEVWGLTNYFSHKQIPVLTDQVPNKVENIIVT